MTVAAGFGMTFVESKSPPRPVSKITRSAGTLEKARNAAAVVISKKVIGLPAFLSLISIRRSDKASSEIKLSARRIRSLKRQR